MPGERQEPSFGHARRLAGRGIRGMIDALSDAPERSMPTPKFEMPPSGRLQLIRGQPARLVNRHPFGRLVANAGRDADAFLKDAGLEVTIRKGGSWAFAAAVYEALLAAERAATFRVVMSNTTIEGVVIETRGYHRRLYLDADGLATRDDLFAKHKYRNRRTPNITFKISPFESDLVLKAGIKPLAHAAQSIGMNALVRRHLDHELLRTTLSREDSA